ncbi:MAG: FAD-dependent oxidoreductase [Phycisphaerales bacterium]
MTRIVRTMQEITERDHDLVVIGGGIHGCLAALDAARRGLRVALIERDDFGGATSWASHRILHGGLRYLQSLDFNRARRSIAERRWYLRTFPDLCEPLRCALPLYGDGLRRPLPFQAALAANAILGVRRNAGIPAKVRLPNGAVEPPARADEINPYARRDGLLGFGTWHDGIVRSHARLTMEILRWAASLGAMAARNVAAVELQVSRGGVVGIEVKDTRSGETGVLRTAAVINAAGPWCHGLARALDAEGIGSSSPVSLAFNLLLDRPAPGGACAVSTEGSDGHTYFLAPRHGLMMAGTTHLPARDGADAPTADDVRAMIHGLNAAAPSLELTESDVLRVDSGRLRAEPRDPATPADRAVIIDHARSGGPAGLVSLSGVKYTTARADAAAAVAIAAGRRPVTPAGRARPEPDPVLRDLNLIDPAWARRADLGPAADALRSLADREGVSTLADLLFRRTEWGQDPRGLADLAERVGRALGWDDDRIRRDVADLVQAPPAPGPMSDPRTARQEPATP